MPEETNISEVNFGKTAPIKFKKIKLKFTVTVTLKKDVLDPQGKAVENTLVNLGMKNLKSIRQGKFSKLKSTKKINKKLKKQSMKFVKNF